MSHDGMREPRPRKGRPKIPRAPETLAECKPGAVVFVCVRVAAHFGQVSQGGRVETLARVFDYDGKSELFAHGDLIIQNSHQVAIYEPTE